MGEIPPALVDPSLSLPAGGASRTLRLDRKIHLDNLFRLAISLSIFAVVLLLWSFALLTPIHRLFSLLVIYSLPYLLLWMYTARKGATRFFDYFLNTLDTTALTLLIYWTGDIYSPFFYLYIIPILVQAFHFDTPIVAWQAGLTSAFYGLLLWLSRAGRHPMDGSTIVGQVVFLGMVIATALLTVRRLRTQQDSLHNGFRALGKTVELQNTLNATPLNGSLEHLHRQMVTLLKGIVEPMGTHVRLWIGEDAWKTLEGIGEHPGQRIGSNRHLPMSACPAFHLRRPFTYSAADGEHCRGERFDYAFHRCLPLTNGSHTFGVLFLGTYRAQGWDADDLRLFETLAQAVALTLQRKALFERLQEKIRELDFSFEVGAASLAAFIGSTHSIDETTVRLLDGVLSILKVDRASLMLWDPRSQSLQTQWVRGGDFQIQTPLRLSMGQGVAGWALESGEPYWAEYAMGDPHYQPSQRQIKSILCVPVYTMDHQPLGVINAVTLEQPRPFTLREIDFLKSFGQQAALAIENAQLHHKDRQNIEKLRDVDRMKSQFLSLVSHDLRGPLTGIRGFCEILHQETAGPLTDDQRRLLSQLERQIDLQERMVNDLLDLARMEKGRFSIRPGPAHLLRILQEEVDKSRAEADEHKITLRLVNDSPGLLPVVLVDENRIRQVAWNLIHNALKFTPENGRVFVRTGFGQGEVLIEVSDTGVGLSPEVQERIFEKFFQISPGGEQSSQGLGLGLAICREIVLAHQGKIWARSAGLGQGTTISFTLPIAQMAVPVAFPNSLAA